MPTARAVKKAVRLIRTIGKYCSYAELCGNNPTRTNHYSAARPALFPTLGGWKMVGINNEESRDLIASLSTTSLTTSAILSKVRRLGPCPATHALAVVRRMSRKCLRICPSKGQSRFLSPFRKSKKLCTPPDLDCGPCSRPQRCPARYQLLEHIQRPN
jgi:hypothetical protein